MIHINKSSHEELTIKAVHKTTMARNGVTKVLRETIVSELLLKWIQWKTMIIIILLFNTTVMVMFAIRVSVIEFLEKIVLKRVIFWYTEVVFYSPREIISTTRIFLEGESKLQTFLKLKSIFSEKKKQQTIKTNTTKPKMFYLNFEGSLESTGKESPKRCNQWAEQRENNGMKLHGIQPNIILRQTTLQRNRVAWEKIPLAY